MAIKMEWTIPKDGVVWGTKYSSSGIRRFSTLELGMGFSLTPKMPARSSALGRRHSATARNTSRNASASAWNDTRKARARSAPSKPRGGCGTTGDRNRDPLGQEASASKEVSAKSSWSRSPSEGGDSQRAKSANWGSVKRYSPENWHSSPASAPSRPRTQSAWGRLVRGVLASPEERTLKAVWGDTVEKMQIATLPLHSPESSTPPSSRVATPSAMSRRPSLISRQSSATSRPPSATSRPVSAKSKSGALSRPPSAVTFTLGPTVDRTAGSVSHHEGDTARVPDQDLPDVTPDAFGRTRAPLTDASVRGGSHPESATQPNVATSCSDTPVGSRPVTSRTAPPEVLPQAKDSKNFVPAAPVFPVTAQPSSVFQHLPGNNHRTVSSGHVFSQELWYKKSSKILATQRAIKRTQADVDEDEHDPEFVVQHLNRPTASSRNRQVNQVPSSHAVSASPSGHSIQSRKKTISIGNPVIHPHRFKGTRSVTSDELHKIVSRLSACDPAQVPDSGCSRSKGKGFSRGAGFGAGFKATSRSAPRSGSGYGVHESAYVLGPSVRGVIY